MEVLPSFTAAEEVDGQGRFVFPSFIDSHTHLIFADSREAEFVMKIASDFNPGSAPSGSMPLVISLACIKMKLTPEEAINAATVNTACALELSDSYGSIAVGKVASVFITKPIPSVAYMPYAFGSDLIETVILKGKIV